MKIEIVEQDLSEIPPWVVDYRVADMKSVPADVINYAMNLHKLLDAVVRVESPIHYSLLLQRIRDHSGVERIGSRIREYVDMVIGHSKYEFDGEFIRLQAKQEIQVRRGTESIVRTVDQIPPEELRRAVELLVSDAVGISHADLVTRVANIFGWRRTGTDIRAKVENEIAELLNQGLLNESGAGLRPGSASNESSS
jgi:hypothetical protein